MPIRSLSEDEIETIRDSLEESLEWIAARLDLPSHMELDRLALLERIRQEIDALITEMVISLREDGYGEYYTWATIGAELGVTKQAAQQRFGPKVAAFLGDFDR